MEKKTAPGKQSRRKGSQNDRNVRERIIAGARRRFFTHGLRGVTMDGLSEDLGLSKKTLYAHFPGKTALVEASLLDKFREIEAELEEITSGRPADFLGSFNRLLACFQRHTEEIHPPFFRDIQREAPGLFEMVETRRRALVQRHIGRFLSQGQKAGIIRDDIPMEAMIVILLGSVEALMNPPKLTELGFTVKSGFVTVITVFLEGVLTEQGKSRL